MRKVSLALLIPVVAACVALVVVAATDERGLVSGFAVNPVAVASEMEPGQATCQSPVVVTETFAHVRFQVGTFSRPGPALAVTIRDARSGSLLGRGTLAAGYPDISKPVVSVGDIPAGRRIRVCIENVGAHRAALFGSTGDQLPRIRLTLDGRARTGELTMSFYAADRPSTLNEVPDIVRRASLFRPAIVGAWTFWLVGLLVIVACPLLLLWALRSSLGGKPDEA